MGNIYYSDYAHISYLKFIFLISDLCAINSCLFEESSICFCLCLQTFGLVSQVRPIPVLVPIYDQVSLMEYGMEWWNGLLNGRWMYTEQLNHVTSALLSLGWAIHTTAWGLTSLQRLYEQVVADIFLLLPRLVRMLSCYIDIVVGYIWLAKLNM